MTDVMYTPRHFRPYELVDEDTYLDLGVNSLTLLKRDILKGIDELRDLVGKPLIVNNWKDGGEYKWSGLRTPKCYIGALNSYHRSGGAFDVKCDTVTAPKLQSMIIDWKKKGLLKTITRMELSTPTWTHIDCRPTGSIELVTFKP